MLVDGTFAIAIAIGMSTVAIFATTKPHGKVPFAFAAISAWFLLGVTTFYDLIDSALTSLGISFGPIPLDGDFVQSILILLVCGGAIVGFYMFGS